MTKNSPKPHLMYFWPETTNTAKTRSFPDTTLPFDDPKQLSPDSDQVLDKSDVRFQRKCPKTWFFLAKMAKFWTKKGSKNGPDFFVRTEILLTISKE